MLNETDGRVVVSTECDLDGKYHNALKAYVQSLSDVERISSVTYGMKLPKKYRNGIDEKLTVAHAQTEAIFARLKQSCNHSS